MKENVMRLQILITLLAGLLAASCDSYSIIEEMESEESTPTPLTMVLSRTDLAVGESITIVPAGGIPSYTVLVQTTEISNITSGNNSGSVVQAENGEFTYTAGQAIGIHTIRMIDGAGNTADKEVLVRPEMVSTLEVTRSGDRKTITLTWTYGTAELIDQFTLEKLPNPTTTTLTPDTRSKTITNLPPNTQFTFTITAHSGQFESLPRTYIVP